MGGPGRDWSTSPVSGPTRISAFDRRRRRRDSWWDSTRRGASVASYIAHENAKTRDRGLARWARRRRTRTPPIATTTTTTTTTTGDDGRDSHRLDWWSSSSSSSSSSVAHTPRRTWVNATHSCGEGCDRRRRRRRRRKRARGVARTTRCAHRFNARAI